jgi:hypothetical protein
MRAIARFTPIRTNRRDNDLNERKVSLEKTADGKWRALGIAKGKPAGSPFPEFIWIIEEVARRSRFVGEQALTELA